MSLAVTLMIEGQEDLTWKRWQRLAEAASEGCPLSALIEASARVSVTATLEGGTNGDSERG